MTLSDSGGEWTTVKQKKNARPKISEKAARESYMSETERPKSISIAEQLLKAKQAKEKNSRITITHQMNISESLIQLNAMNKSKVKNSATHTQTIQPSSAPLEHSNKFASGLLHQQYPHSTAGTYTYSSDTVNTNAANSKKQLPHSSLTVPNSSLTVPNSPNAKFPASNLIPPSSTSNLLPQSRSTPAVGAALASGVTPNLHNPTSTKGTPQQLPLAPSSIKFSPQVSFGMPPSASNLNGITTLATGQHTTDVVNASPAISFSLEKVGAAWGKKGQGTKASNSIMQNSELKKSLPITGKHEEKETTASLEQQMNMFWMEDLKKLKSLTNEGIVQLLERLREECFVVSSMYNIDSFNSRSKTNNDSTINNSSIDKKQIPSNNNSQTKDLDIVQNSTSLTNNHDGDFVIVRHGLLPPLNQLDSPIFTCPAPLLDRIQNASSQEDITALQTEIKIKLKCGASHSNNNNNNNNSNNNNNTNKALFINVNIGLRPTFPFAPPIFALDFKSPWVELVSLENVQKCLKQQVNAMQMSNTPCNLWEPLSVLSEEVMAMDDSLWDRMHAAKKKEGYVAHLEEEYDHNYDYASDTIPLLEGSMVRDTNNINKNKNDNDVDQVEDNFIVITRQLGDLKNKVHANNPDNHNRRITTIGGVNNNDSSDGDSSLLSNHSGHKMLFKSLAQPNANSKLIPTASPVASPVHSHRPNPVSPFLSSLPPPHPLFADHAPLRTSLDPRESPSLSPLPHVSSFDSPPQALLPSLFPQPAHQQKKPSRRTTPQTHKQQPPDSSVKKKSRRSKTDPPRQVNNLLQSNSQSDIALSDENFSDSSRRSEGEDITDAAGASPVSSHSSHILGDRQLLLPKVLAEDPAVLAVNNGSRGYSVPSPSASAEAAVAVAAGLGWDNLFVFCVTAGLRPSRYMTDFEEQRMLGHGGFGFVTKVRHKLDRRAYAVKRVELPATHEQRYRVMSEASRLPRLQHKHIVRYYSAWIEEEIVILKPLETLLDSNDRNNNRNFSNGRAKTTFDHLGLSYLSNSIRGAFDPWKALASSKGDHGLSHLDHHDWWTGPANELDLSSRQGFFDPHAFVLSSSHTFAQSHHAAVDLRQVGGGLASVSGQHLARNSQFSSVYPGVSQAILNSNKNAAFHHNFRDSNSSHAIIFANSTPPAALPISSVHDSQQVPGPKESLNRVLALAENLITSSRSRLPSVLRGFASDDEADRAQIILRKQHRRGRYRSDKFERSERKEVASRKSKAKERSKMLMDARDTESNEDHASERSSSFSSLSSSKRLRQYRGRREGNRNEQDDVIDDEKKNKKKSSRSRKESDRKRSLKKKKSSKVNSESRQNDEKNSNHHRKSKYKRRHRSSSYSSSISTSSSDIFEKKKNKKISNYDNTEDDFDPWTAYLEQPAELRTASLDKPEVVSRAGSFSKSDGITVAKSLNDDRAKKNNTLIKADEKLFDDEKKSKSKKKQYSSKKDSEDEFVSKRAITTKDKKNDSLTEKRGKRSETEKSLSRRYERERSKKSLFDEDFGIVFASSDQDSPNKHRFSGKSRQKRSVTSKEKSNNLYKNSVNLEDDNIRFVDEDSSSSSSSDQPKYELPTKNFQLSQYHSVRNKKEHQKQFSLKVPQDPHESFAFDKDDDRQLLSPPSSSSCVQSYSAQMNEGLENLESKDDRRAISRKNKKEHFMHHSTFLNKVEKCIAKDGKKRKAYQQRNSLYDDGNDESSSSVSVAVTPFVGDNDFIGLNGVDAVDEDAKSPIVINHAVATNTNRDSISSTSELKGSKHKKLSAYSTSIHSTSNIPLKSQQAQIQTNRSILSMISSSAANNSSEINNTHFSLNRNSLYDLERANRTPDSVEVPSSKIKEGRKVGAISKKTSRFDLKEPAYRASSTSSCMSEDIKVKQEKNAKSKPSTSKVNLHERIKRSALMPSTLTGSYKGVNLFTANSLSPSDEYSDYSSSDAVHQILEKKSKPSKLTSKHKKIKHKASKSRRRSYPSSSSSTSSSPTSPSIRCCFQTTHPSILSQAPRRDADERRLQRRKLDRQKHSRRILACDSHLHDDGTESAGESTLPLKSFASSSAADISYILRLGRLARFLNSSCASAHKGSSNNPLFELRKQRAAFEEILMSNMLTAFNESPPSPAEIKIHHVLDNQIAHGSNPLPSKVVDNKNKNLLKSANNVDNNEASLTIHSISSHSTPLPATPTDVLTPLPPSAPTAPLPRPPAIPVREPILEPRRLTLHFLYIQQEYCAGETLKAGIDSGALFSCPPAERWRLFHQLLDAVVYMHAKGLIHRDLKPANVFLDKNGDVKVGDFGLAAVANQPGGDHTGADQLLAENDHHARNLPKVLNLSAGVGTLFYTAPEVEKSGNYDSKADMFSLGVILFEMWHTPFVTDMERCRVLFQLTKHQILPDSFKVPKEVASIVSHLLNPNPSLRPSAQDLIRSRLLPPVVEEGLLDRVLDQATNPYSVEIVNLMRRLMKRPEPGIAEMRSIAYFANEAQATDWKMHVSKDEISSFMEQVFRSRGAVRTFIPPMDPVIESYADLPAEDLQTHAAAASNRALSLISTSMATVLNMDVIKVFDPVGFALLPAAVAANSSSIPATGQTKPNSAANSNLINSYAAVQASRPLVFLGPPVGRQFVLDAAAALLHLPFCLTLPMARSAFCIEGPSVKKRFGLQPIYGDRANLRLENGLQFLQVYGNCLGIPLSSFTATEDPVSGKKQSASGSSSMDMPVMNNEIWFGFGNAVKAVMQQQQHGNSLVLAGGKNASDAANVNFQSVNSTYGTPIECLRAAFDISVANPRRSDVLMSEDPLSDVHFHCVLEADLINTAWQALTTIRGRSSLHIRWSSSCIIPVVLKVFDVPQSKISQVTLLCRNLFGPICCTSFTSKNAYNEALTGLELAIRRALMALLPVQYPHRHLTLMLLAICTAEGVAVTSILASILKYHGDLGTLCNLLAHEKLAKVRDEFFGEERALAGEMDSKFSSSTSRNVVGFIEDDDSNNANGVASDLKKKSWTARDDLSRSIREGLDALSALLLRIRKTYSLVAVSKTEIQNGLRACLLHEEKVYDEGFHFEIRINCPNAPKGFTSASRVALGGITSSIACCLVKPQRRIYAFGLSSHSSMAELNASYPCYPYRYPPTAPSALGFIAPERYPAWQLSFEIDLDLLAYRLNEMDVMRQQAASIGFGKRFNSFKVSKKTNNNNNNSSHNNASFSQTPEDLTSSAGSLAATQVMMQAAMNAIATGPSPSLAFQKGAALKTPLAHARLPLVLVVHQTPPLLLDAMGLVEGLVRYGINSDVRLASANYKFDVHEYARRQVNLLVLVTLRTMAGQDNAKLFTIRSVRDYPGGPEKQLTSSKRGSADDNRIELPDFERTLKQVVKIVRASMESVRHQVQAQLMAAQQLLIQQQLQQQQNQQVVDLISTIGDDVTRRNKKRKR